MKYKVGDKVRVALEWSWYISRMTDTFKENDIVEIVLTCEKDCKVRDYSGNYWRIWYKDIMGLEKELENKCGYFIS